MELVRKIRYKVDQELTRRNIDPLFKENYYSYDKDEFLIDADFEFVKVKNLLDRNPKVLKEDPVLSIDYLKIINLIKQKKLLELTSDHFDPSSALEASYYDIEKSQRLLELHEQRSRQQFEKGYLAAESEIVTGLSSYD